MKKQTNRFNRLLSSMKRRWQTGLLLCVILRTAGWIVVSLGIYCVLDFFLALSSPARVILDVAVLSFIVFLLSSRTAAVFTFKDRTMAERADEVTGNARRSILSAYELDAWINSIGLHSEGLQDYLVDRSINQAADKLVKIKTKDQFPVPGIVRQLKTFLLQVCIVVLIAALNPAAPGVILKRIFLPLRDIPPYSSYVFTISPAEPGVIYGGDAEISVEITGRPVKSQVWFMTRYKNDVRRTACFQESGGQRFAQRIEKVVSPVEFCFSTGKARSRWQSITLLMRPRISLALARLTPPEYANRPAREFFIGNEPLAGLKNSKVELTIKSNRPLLDGTMTIVPKNNPNGEEIVPGTKTDQNSVAFIWQMKEPSELQITVRDIQGTGNRDPFVVEQMIIPDNPPEAVITEPDLFVLATPNTTLPLKGYCEDDIGLKDIELVRTVVGYRDRTRRIGPEAPAESFRMDKELNLDTLGTKPGQVLEFYVEASDLNPSMTGVTASEIVRVMIISEQEYAAMLRAKTSLEEFMARYRQMQEELNNVKDALRELKEQADAQNSDAEKTDEALKKAQEAIENAAEFFEKLSKDFPAYDMEKALAETAGTIAEAMKQAGQRLAGANSATPGLSAIAGELLAQLGEQEKLAGEQLANAEETEMIAKVMQFSPRFMNIVRKQAELERRLSRLGNKEKAADAKLLAALAERQKEIRKELTQLRDELAEQAGKLPDEYSALRDSALEFAGKIDELQIPGFMDKASSAAENQDGRSAHQNALLALEKLKQMLSESNSGEFGALGNCEIKFTVPKPIETTLQQMLSSMGMGMGRDGGGSGMGGMGKDNMGLDGNPDDGYGMGGQSPLNTPVFGPDRMSFRQSQAGNTGTGRDARGTYPVKVKVDSTEGFENTGTMDIRSESVPVENIPAKYRDAIKKYFSDSK